MGTTELILYKNIEHDEILKGMERLMNQEEVKEGRKALYFDMIHKILDLSAKHGFEGNLWHTYLTFLLVNQETVFSVANELSGKVKGSINEIAFRDYGIFREFFHWDIKKLDKEFHTDCCRMIVNYRRALSDSKVFQQKVRERICQLSIKLASAKNSKRFMSIMVKFYKDFGVGKLGLHKGFRVEEREGKVELLPITSIAPVRLEDLVGYEIAKKKLIENTEAFIEGRRANNCLLFGDAGTGKSSSMKGILNAYYDKGLRMIELYKHQLTYIHEVIEKVKHRNYKFILFMDDLSFEDFETEYKYLKALIEGGLEKKPDNILIYATSNRRHFIREKFSDKEDRREDLHTSDIVQEKLSLASRFGITIYFGAPDKKEFEQIVKVLGKRSGLDIQEKQLLFEANKWELTHGGRSGRSAQQFIDYLLGKQKGRRDFG